VQPLRARARVRDDRAELGHGRAVGHQLSEHAVPAAAPRPGPGAGAHAQRGERARHARHLRLEEQVLAPLGADDADVPQARSLSQQLHAQRGRRAAAQRAD